MSDPTTDEIAVVIPCFNRKHLVLDALGSVARQTLPPGKVIVVDDGSTDGTQLAVKHWHQTKAPQLSLEYIYQQNSGPGAARNRGIEAAGGYIWVAFLDSDDLWHPDHLSTLMAAIRNHPDAVAASNELRENYYADNGELVSSRLFFFSPNLVSGRVNGPEAFRFTGPLTPATIVRRDCLMAAGGFESSLKYAEDKLLFMEVSTMGYWCRVPGHPAIYRNFPPNGQRPHTCEKQLSDSPHQNSRLAYARLLELKVGHLIGSNGRYHQGLKWALWKAWYRAGRHLEKTGHYRWAAGYFLQAARYRPTSKAIPRAGLVQLKKFFSKMPQNAFNNDAGKH